MRVIHFNVSGTATDVPQLMVDNSAALIAGDVSEAGHALFTLPDTVAAGVGATVVYGLQGRTARIITPPGTSGRFEADLAPVRPADAPDGPLLLDYGPAYGRLQVDAQGFIWRGARVYWRGCSEFRLPARVGDGEDVRLILAERKALGANVVRCLAMKFDNIGWTLDPRRGDYWAVARATWDLIGNEDLACEWTVFADTRLLGMREPHEQHEFWERTKAESIGYPHVALEGVNEIGHPTQDIDAGMLDVPGDRVVSRGSGQTDEDVARPLGTYAAFHSRRIGWRAADGSLDARGASNMSPYAFQENYPKSVPFVSDESPKPQDYRHDAQYAALMGRHARAGFGGTFHSDEGIHSLLFPDDVAACARAFFDALR